MANGNKPCSLHFLTLLSVLTMLSAVANGVSYGFGLVGNGRALANDAANIKEIWFIFFLNLYGLCFAFTVMLVETRYKGFYDHFPGFKNWAIRGLFLTFIGVLSLGLGASSSPFTDPDARDIFEQVREILAFSIFGIGLLYVVGEVLCIRSRLQHTKEQYVHDSGLFLSSRV